MTGMSSTSTGRGHSSNTSRDESSSSAMDASKRRIPSEQWEAKRGIITQLYQEEKRSLKEVMTIMEKQYSFNAT